LVKSLICLVGPRRPTVSITEQFCSRKR
jgi:hypothetical protein